MKFRVFSRCRERLLLGNGIPHAFCLLWSCKASPQLLVESLSRTPRRHLEAVKMFLYISEVPFSRRRSDSLETNHRFEAQSMGKRHLPSPTGISVRFRGRFRHICSSDRANSTSVSHEQLRTFQELRRFLTSNQRQYLTSMVSRHRLRALATETTASKSSDDR